MRERAQILLWSDAGKSDLEIAGLLHRTPLTIAQTRKRWATNHFQLQREIQRALE